MANKQADNRYSKVKWGETKWGASATNNALSWGLEIDFDGNGLFDGTNESNRLQSFSGFNGRKNMLKPTGGGFEQFEIGDYTFVLDNYDGRYDPYNTSSPLYPNVTDGKDVRFRSRDLSGTNSPYPVFYGVIQEVLSVPGDGTNPVVQLHVFGNWNYLRNTNAKVSMQQSISPDNAISKILETTNWPVRWGQSLDSSADTIGYYWASGKTTAGTEVENISNSGAGLFFINAQGQAVYKTRSDIPAATLNLDQSQLLKDIQPSQPQANKRNVTRMTVHPMTLAANGIIWKLSGTSPSVPTGAANALIFTANYSYNNIPAPAINVIQPVASTDWKVTQNADGSGADYTASCTFAIVDNGDNALCTVTNNSGSLGYLSLAQINGQSVYVLNTVDVTYPSDPTTIINPRQFYQDLTWQQDVNIAASIVGVLGPFFSGTFPVIAIKLQGQPSLQFALDIMDTITLTAPAIGFSGYSLRVGGIEMTSNSNMQDITTTVYLEPYAVVLNTGVYDTAVYDTPNYGW